MLRLRLKRLGRKQSPFYRIVVMENSTKRDGRSIDEVGIYDPIGKNVWVNQKKLEKWLKYGVKPTRRVSLLLDKNKQNSEYDYTYEYEYNY